MLEAEAVMEKGPQYIPESSKKRQLMVVDDSEAIQKILSRILSFMGYDVTLAGNGLEAATLFLTGSYDLVMTDFQMPLTNGWELSRIVKEKPPNTPVVVITGASDDKVWEKLNTNSIDSIIPKPFKLQEIEQTVQMLLSSGT
jgi:CheY-like chemotaxis protein